MKTIEEQIAVMKHFANGGKVEYRDNEGNWHLISDPMWNWRHYNYRIAEEIDPYAELKAANTPGSGKQIRVFNSDTWRNAGSIWAFDLPVSSYEIRDKPKSLRKVKLLAWFDGESLFWRTEGCFGNSLLTRVPAEDKIIGVEDN